MRQKDPIVYLINNTRRKEFVDENDFVEYLNTIMVKDNAHYCRPERSMPKEVNVILLLWENADIVGQLIVDRKIRSDEFTDDERKLYSSIYELQGRDIFPVRPTLPELQIPPFEISDQRLGRQIDIELYNKILVIALPRLITTIPEKFSPAEIGAAPPVPPCEEAEEENEEKKKEENEQKPEDSPPSKTYRLIDEFQRNSVVRLNVLERARGLCELCGKATFKKKKVDESFLYVHHIKSLGEGGVDTTKNAAALCPNCHAEIHYGEYGEKINGKLQEIIQQLEAIKSNE